MQVTYLKIIPIILLAVVFLGLLWSPYGLQYANWDAGGIFLTTLAILVALFAAEIREFFWHAPELSIGDTEKKVARIETKVLRSQLNNSMLLAPFKNDAIFWGIWIENLGNIRAENVEVIVNDVRKIENGTAQPLSTFIPLPLNWTYGDGKPVSLSPKIGRFVDIGSIEKSRDFCYAKGNFAGPPPTEGGKYHFVLALSTDPSSKQGYLPPGSYELVLLVVAANAKGQRFSITLEHNGEWPPSVKIGKAQVKGWL